MTVLITGGTGFIGSHLAEYLAQRGEPVRCLVRQGSDTSFLRSFPGVTLACGDVTRKETLPEALSGVDTIYHLAAALDARHYPEKTYWQCNVTGTRNMLTPLDTGIFLLVLLGIPIAVIRAEAEHTFITAAKIWMP